MIVALLLGKVWLWLLPSDVPVLRRKGSQDCQPNNKQGDQRSVGVNILREILSYNQTFNMFSLQTPISAPSSWLALDFWDAECKEG